MSTDCENLLKKFLILNPSKRGTLEVSSLQHQLAQVLGAMLLTFSFLPLSLPFAPQQIMKDRWMNVGHEDDELKPYVEPLPDYKDPRRTGEATVGPGG